MKALCLINVSSSPYDIGTANTDLNENTITLNFILPATVSSAYLTITNIGGISTNTSSLTLSGNEIEYVLPTTYYYAGAGTVKAKVIGNDSYESGEVNLIINGLYTSSDNVFVETSGNNFIIKKVTESGGGGGGTSDYNDLTNKPSLNTTASTSLSTSANEEINNTINLHKVSKTGSYNDLVNKPTIPSKTSDITNDSGYITKSVNDLINYYRKTQTYSQTEVNNLIAEFITSQVTLTGGYGGRYETSDGLLIQWGAAAIYTTPNVIIRANFNYPIAYVSNASPVAFANPFTNVIDSQVKGCCISYANHQYCTIDLLRTNSVSTTVCFVVIGKKG